MNDDRNKSYPYLPRGPTARHDGLEEGEPDCGSAIHCWLDVEVAARNCYVAFFDNHQLNEKPTEKPYILRYTSTSLAFVEKQRASLNLGAPASSPFVTIFVKGVCIQRCHNA